MARARAAVATERTGDRWADAPRARAAGGNARPDGAPPDGRVDLRAEDAPDVFGAPPAHRFVGRVAQLDPDAVRAAVATWRESMRHDLEAWFAAEEAVARAVVAAGRHHEQRPLLMHLAEAFAHYVWYGSGRPRLTPGDAAPELRAQATEASGQYLGTLAMLALLVRDHLAPEAFALLYRPFAILVPLAALARE
jgi:hypothetical protein